MAKNSPTLDAYRRKRDVGGTPEPIGGPGVERPGFFVVQQHSARRLHYDFRLEIDGVLRSWAIPKGPSLDPQQKRLAVATEDHPLEYGDFEGVIPPGNYGAGAVIVWDRGRCIHKVEPSAGADDGKLLFELHGYKLRGLWTLVRTKRNPKEWLLIKKADAAASSVDASELGSGSVLSGLTVEELGAGESRTARIRRQLKGWKAPQRRMTSARLRPMLARLTPKAFSRPGWLYELKYDGYRMMVSKSGKKVRLSYRSGLDATRIYPDLVLALAHLPYEHLVIDGEVVVLDEEGKPSFSLLQQRARLSRDLDIQAATVRLPTVLFLFDLLAFDSFDLRSLPLIRRKQILGELLPEQGPLRFANHVEDRGEEFFAEVRKMGLEGILAKRAQSAYRAGRHDDWLKIRADRTGDFVVVGYTRPKESRSGFGALHLAVMHGSKMVYAGRVGSGFSEADLEELSKALEGMRRPQPPLEKPPPFTANDLWVEPKLAIEVQFTEYTDAGQLRHPVFLRLRTDKVVKDCVREDLPPPPTEAQTPDPRQTAKRIEVTRPQKVFWPQEGTTKGDLVGYYRAIAPWLLVYLRNRPVVLDRYPDGIDGKSFFQKNAPEFAPSWVRTESIWSEDSGKETRYFVCDDEETLVYLINSGSIPLHIWSSRIESLQHPDWCILDLDAKDAPFEYAVIAARQVRQLCRKIELPCFIKTSGASGLHVLVPLGGQCTHEQSRQLAELIARYVARELPEQTSVARTPAARKGKIYLDYLQNGYGKLLVSPFSVRPLAGAPVSTPLRWTEVTKRLDKNRFHLKSVPRRLKRMGTDPLAEILELRPDLPRALSSLGELLET